jgi:antitoxin component of MazEF toxin-antitoxin module
MRISRRVNDLAVRIPASLVRELDLHPGDEVDLTYIHKLAEAVGDIGRRKFVAGLIKVAPATDTEKPASKP